MPNFLQDILDDDEMMHLCAVEYNRMQYIRHTMCEYCYYFQKILNFEILHLIFLYLFEEKKISKVIKGRQV